MNKKIKNVYLSIFILLVITSIVSINYGTKENNIFNQIIKETKSTPMESGITMYYEIKSDGRTECKDWLKSMNLYDNKIENKSLAASQYKISSMSVTAEDIKFYNLNNDKNVHNNITVNDNKVFCVQFEKGNIYGFIESKKTTNNTQMSIFIRKISNTYDIENLYDKLEASINKDNVKQSCFKYIKLKSNEKEINTIQDNVTRTIKRQGAINIATVTTNNGFSSVALTNQFSPIKDGGENIDFNYAVLHETGNNYIILGTPLIDIAY